MGVTLTLLNQKGGVGKTSLTHHLAGALSARGRRVLLVDNDPQASLTQGFIGPAACRSLDRDTTVAGLYRGQSYAESVRFPVGIPGVDLIAGSRWATPFNLPEPETLDWSLQRTLADGLDSIRGEYDLVLIDCPPNLHLCSWAALAASDALIVPLKPEDYGAQGIIEVNDSYQSVRARINPGLALLGYLLTLLAPRKTVHKMYEQTLRESYGPLVFDARMPDLTEFVEALNGRQAAEQYKPKGAAAKAMRAIADEIESRLAAVSLGQERGAA